MKVRLIKSCNYYAYPFKFSPKNPIEDVPKKLGQHLLSTGYFEEAIEGQGVKLETEQEKEKKVSKSNKLYEESKKKEK